MKEFSFPSKYRLVKRDDFLNLRKKQSKQNKYFIANFEENKKDNCRLGITITKKVGKANFRNKVKRIIREFFRLNKHKIKKNFDINIIAKKNVSLLNKKEIAYCIEKLFKNFFFDM